MAHLFEASLISVFRVVELKDMNHELQKESQSQCIYSLGYLGSYDLLNYNFMDKLAEDSCLDIESLAHCLRYHDIFDQHHQIFDKEVVAVAIAEHRSFNLCFYYLTCSKRFQYLRAIILECSSWRNEDQCESFQNQHLDILCVNFQQHNDNLRSLLSQANFSFLGQPNSDCDSFLSNLGLLEVCSKFQAL
jgi:hypothetical protein